jgi:Amt family ammonium transporter
VAGLFFGGGADQLVAQLVGIVSCVVIVSLVSFVVFRIIRSFPGSWNLRIERELELEGIDIAEHGLPAYHMELGQGMTYTTSSGLGATGLFGASASHGPGPTSVATPTSPVLRPEPPSRG